MVTIALFTELMIDWSWSILETKQCQHCLNLNHERKSSTHCWPLWMIPSTSSKNKGMVLSNSEMLLMITGPVGYLSGFTARAHSVIRCFDIRLYSNYALCLYSSSISYMWPCLCTREVATLHFKMLPSPCVDLLAGRIEYIRNSCC